MMESVGYDQKSRTLEIEFEGGAVYEYFNVPRTTYDGLMAASSHGKYFHRWIKDQFRYRRI